MGIHEENALRERFERERLELIAGRLMYLAGSRSMVLALDNDDGVQIWCSTGRLLSSYEFIGDAIVNAGDCEDRPLRELLGI